MGAPTFALHGWLDNANSFDRLAPLLPELDLIALDFAGHGFSSHAARRALHLAARCAGRHRIANELGWEQFNLIGHSMARLLPQNSPGFFRNASNGPS
jgi:pimeloyl-ACP methyl ester carboxylesterase